LALGVLLAGHIAPAQADLVPGGTLNPADPFNLQFDEAGNGMVSIDGGPFMPVTGFVGLDPNSKMTTLIYQLPELVGSGEILVKDADGHYGDAIDFFTQGGTSFMAVYSDKGGPDPADVGVPILTSFFISENPDGTYDYVIPNDNEYHGRSSPDAVPEPASWTLAGVGFLTFLGYRLRRRRRA
jgi:hypothetical protein